MQYTSYHHLRGILCWIQVGAIAGATQRKERDECKRSEALSIQQSTERMSVTNWEERLSVEWW